MIESLKEKMGPNAKYVFWGVWATTILTAIIVWWMATGALASKAQSQKSAIDSAYSGLESIRRTASTHPNDFSHTGMSQRVDVAQTDVLGAWNKQWQYQESILVWPEELNQKGRTDFVDAFKVFLPIETTTEFPMPESAEVDQTLRKRYLTYIEDQLPGLAEIVGSKWKADFKATGVGLSAMGVGGGGSGGMSMDFGGGNEGETSGEMNMGATGPKVPEDRLVTWSKDSQGRLLEQVFPWRTKEAPSTLEVLYSQEDLWALTGLLQIIASVNKGAKQPFQCHIHEIVDIKLGKAVAARVGKVKTAASMAAGAMGMGMEGTSSPMGMASPGMETGMVSGMVDPASVDPADNRYVSNTYEAIPASQLRSAMASASPTNAFMNVAKRLPVSITVKMDQRKLPLLLSECGNAQLMVEVRQVRVNQSTTTGGGGMGLGMSMNMMGEGSGGPDQKAATPVAEDYPFDLPIEVNGVIYIYNPPDLKKLGVDEVTTETVVEAAGPGTTAETETDTTATDPADTSTPPADSDTSTDTTTDPAAPNDPAATTEPADDGTTEPATAG